MPLADRADVLEARQADPLVFLLAAEIEQRLSGGCGSGGAVEPGNGPAQVSN